MSSIFILQVLEKCDLVVWDITIIGYFGVVFDCVSNMQEILYMRIFTGIFIVFIILAWFNS